MKTATVTKLPTRAEARTYALDKMNKTMDALEVLNPTFKSYIREKYKSAMTRISAMDIDKAKWPMISTENLYKEYNEVAEQIELVAIFSDKFDQLIYTMWLNMINTFNPSSNQYKD